MITLLQNGEHKLIETKKNTKVLYLDDATYAWVEPTAIGEILVSSHATHKADCVLSVGDYYLFDITDEPELSDNMHLELEVGRNVWQGYLLLTGLPTDSKKRVRIIPTTEVIMGNPHFSHITAKER